MYKIAVVGPESTGKSELAQALAKHYQGEWIPEYAREYVEGLGRKYEYEDVCHIARKQIEEQAKYENNMLPGFVFFDTELIITKVWLDFCYKKRPEFLDIEMEKSFFDFYLLCDYDLKWIADSVREHGDDRSYFFDLYQSEIQKTGISFTVVSGQNEIRTQNAILAIDNFLKRIEKMMMLICKKNKKL